MIYFVLGHFLEIGLGERLDIAGFDSILTSEIHSTSISEASKLKNFPGLRPWTPLGGLQRPPDPQLFGH